ncbi:homeobox protein Meis1-like isoform X2 [Lutzomyia longipalpis]|uniref:homeobox protein Meis1-like isoform X2 n=1 Tax=Lutzomyia longipalpis TaxID=7200 RepID=UPI0024837772|nr:homeobox protein Meis1-like isoform X2 [Lutzomyia longipalpis]
MQENSITASAVMAPNANGIDQAQFEADKRAVYKHPLFSLLALLLEKCEQATQGYVPAASASSASSNSSSPNGTNGNCDNDSFSRDIQAFVQLLEKEKRPLLTNDSELDGLMIKALQVLRIHLLELEKVQELCRDFCTRYIACLRGKMQSENLLRADYPMEHNNNLSNSSSPANTPDQEQMTNQAGGYYGNSDFLSGTDGTDFSSLQAPGNLLGTTNGATELHQNTPGGAPEAALLAGAAAAASSAQQPLHVQTQVQNLVSSQASSGSPQGGAGQILGSTPLSQIGCPPLQLDQYAGQLSPCGSSDEVDSELDSNNDELGSNFSTNSGSKRQKRGILPKHATSVMRAWLFQHLVHPYPTEDEKRAIAAQTNLTLLQVNNWFINARRRILQPMLEHANDSNQNSVRKKSSSQSPSKRFWSDGVSASGQPAINPAMIDPNIENISANVNRADAGATQKIPDNYYSSDESTDSLIIDQDT